jgi:hypothetical protein
MVMEEQVDIIAKNFRGWIKKEIIRRVIWAVLSRGEEDRKRRLWKLDKILRRA